MAIESKDLGQVISIKNAAVSYLLAVSISSLVFVFLSEGVTMISSGGFESATNNDFLTKVVHLILITLLLFLVGWIFSCVTALLPFVLGIAIARALKLTHWAYFVVGATIVAIAIIPLSISIPNLGINEQGIEPTFREQFLRIAPYFVASGLSAGWVCWWYLSKYFPRNKYH